MSANDRQVGGSHYESEYQHWDFCADAFGDTHFKNAISKYIARWRKKGGLLDLEKASHYLEKMRELRENHGLALSTPLDPSAPGRFCILNNLPTLEALVILEVSFAISEYGLASARRALNKLHQQAMAEEMAKQEPKSP